ncbi:MAG TPA: 50S ribosomal protein L32 [Bacteroidetes bacterium]|nr:50S ribosomal protein L32 [Bacteroidota bacterium]
MAHPRTRHSKRRQRNRRTHYKKELPTLSTCPTTGEVHQRHRAYYDDEGNMRYRGQVLIKAEDEYDD